MTPKCPDCRRDQEDCICFPSAKMNRTIDRQAAQIEVLKAQMLRIIGEHYAPSDCYSTGPLHGDFLDHSCPSCEGLEMLSAIQDQALEQFAAKVREQCAKSCEMKAEMVRCDSAACQACATTIRAIKELP